MEIIVKNADFSANKIGVVAETIDAVTFNGTSSYAGITELLLSSNGDYVEFDLDVNSTDVNPGYAFSQYYYSETGRRPAIGISTTKFWLRLSDSTWAVNNQSHDLTSLSHVLVKVAFEGTNINVYFNGSETPKFTYDNTLGKSLSIIQFGHYVTGDTQAYWSGTIHRLRTNKQGSGEWISATSLAGWTPTNVIVG